MEDLFALLDDKAGTERRFIVAFCKVIYLYIIDSDTALLYQPSDLALGGGKPAIFLPRWPAVNAVQLALWLQ